MRTRVADIGSGLLLKSLKIVKDKFKNAFVPKAEDIIAEDDKLIREERQRLQEATNN